MNLQERKIIYTPKTPYQRSENNKNNIYNHADSKEKLEKLFVLATTRVSAIILSATGVVGGVLDEIKNAAVVMTAVEIKNKVKDKLAEEIDDLISLR